MTDEFNFDESQLDLTEQELSAIDQEFLNTMQQKTENLTVEESNDAFTFWFLIVLLLVFIFFIALGVIMVVKGRKRRIEYAMVGYRV